MRRLVPTKPSKNAEINGIPLDGRVFIAHWHARPEAQCHQQVILNLAESYLRGGASRPRRRSDTADEHPNNNPGVNRRFGKSPTVEHRHADDCSRRRLTPTDPPARFKPRSKQANKTWHRQPRFCPRTRGRTAGRHDKTSPGKLGNPPLEFASLSYTSAVHSEIQAPFANAPAEVPKRQREQPVKLLASPPGVLA